MFKLASSAAILVAAALGTVASAVVAPPLLTVTLRPQATQPAQTLAAGRRTLVVRNGAAVARDFQLLRIDGGTASLIRFEGLLFLPETRTLVRRLGRVAPGQQTRAVVTLGRGDYVLAATSGNVVTASRDLRVT